MVGPVPRSKKGDNGLASIPRFPLWATGMVGVTLVFAFQPLYPGLIGSLTNILHPACALVAFLCSLSCLRRYGISRKLDFGAVWMLFTLGTGIWVLAESTWAFYYFVLQVAVPYPSVADFFYVGGYLPIIAGLLGYLDTFRVALTRRRLGYSLVVIGCGITLALTFVLPVELGQNLSAINFLTDMIYPVLDLVLLSLAVLSLAIFAGGSIAKWWMLFGAGASLYVIADEFFLYQVAHGTYYNGSIDDLIYLLGYLTFAMSFYTHREEF